MSRDLIALVLLAALALGIGLGGAAGVPLNDHEIFVAQTAQNMLASHDWVVPHLNGHLRLEKPPLSYWMSAVWPWLNGEQSVAPLDVRLPSVVAALCIVWLVFAVARCERNRATALMAALIAVTSLGFFRYVHNGRPDMLYAFFAFLMCVCYWAGGRTASPGRQRGWALLFWLAFGLHILTKGPQFGGVVLAACLFHGFATRQTWRDLYRRFSPLMGLAVLALVVVPWWWLLDQRVGPQLSHSQLSGSLLSVSPLRVVNPYYWIHAPGMWLPWGVPLVAAVPLAWRQRAAAPGLFALIILLAIIVFTMGPQYRKIYMLPTLGPAAVLLGLGAERLWLGVGRPALIGFWLLIALLAVFCVGGLAWLGLHIEKQWFGFAVCAAVAIMLLLIAAWRLIAARGGNAGSRWQGLSLVSVAVGVALMQAAVVPAIWSETRFNEYRLTQDLAPYRNRPMTVLAPLKPAVYVYYLGRRIAVSDNIDALCRWQAAYPRSRPLVLYHPAQAAAVIRALPDITPLLQSPGSFDSSVIAAEIPPARGRQCRAAGTGKP